MRKISFIIILFAALVSPLLFSVDALALNVQSSHPNPGPTGTFNTYGARTLPQLGFDVGIATQFTNQPLVFRDFTTGDQKQKLVNWIETTNLGAEFGAADWATIGVDIPFSFMRYGLRTNVTMREVHASIGDITAYGKFAILHPDSFPVGISAMPFIVAPTGSTAHFTGDRNMDLGGRLIADKEFDRGYIGMNVGYKAHMRNDIVEAVGSTGRLMVDDELLFGLGGGYDVLDKKVRIFAEFMGATAAAHFCKDEQTSPMEINGGVQLGAMDNAMKFTVGGGAGLNGGYGAPQFRIFAGLTYNSLIERDKKAASEKPKRIVVETIILQGVNFDTNKYDILPSSKRILDENYAKLEKYPIEHFKLIGHTDFRASEEYNQTLSENRARSVMEYFIKKGISRDRMESEGHGELEPIAPNDSPENMWLNRRVEIQVLR